jgi:hypothetical protein
MNGGVARAVKDSYKWPQVNRNCHTVFKILLLYVFNTDHTRLLLN